MRNVSYIGLWPVYLYGNNLSLYREPFGQSGSTKSGYFKEFTYDARLSYAPPPHALQQGLPIWNELDYVICPTSSCPAIG